MIMKMISSWIKHLSKKEELRFKQIQEAATKSSEEKKVEAKTRLAALDQHKANILAIKRFSYWDEYTKYGKSGFGIEKYDEKVSVLKAGLETLLVDLEKPELGYAKSIDRDANELNRTFSKATRIWHESVLGQEHDGEKGKAAGEFRSSTESASALSDALTRMRNEFALENSKTT
jgi:hypothetical protein